MASVDVLAGLKRFSDLCANDYDDVKLVEICSTPKYRTTFYQPKDAADQKDLEMKSACYVVTLFGKMLNFLKSSELPLLISEMTCIDDPQVKIMSVAWRLVLLLDLCRKANIMKDAIIVLGKSKEGEVVVMFLNKSHFTPNQLKKFISTTNNNS